MTHPDRPGKVPSSPLAGDGDPQSETQESIASTPTTSSSSAPGATSDAPSNSNEPEEHYVFNPHGDVLFSQEHIARYATEEEVDNSKSGADATSRTNPSSSTRGKEGDEDLDTILADLCANETEHPDKQTPFPIAAEEVGSATVKGSTTVKGVVDGLAVLAENHASIIHEMPSFFSKSSLPFLPDPNSAPQDAETVLGSIYYAIEDRPLEKKKILEEVKKIINELALETEISNASRLLGFAKSCKPITLKTSRALKPISNRSRPPPHKRTSEKRR